MTAKMCKLLRKSHCYIKRLPKMENRKIQNDPQICRKDFARKCFQPSFDPSEDSYATVTDPSSIFKTPGPKKSDFQLTCKIEVEYLKYILNYCMTRLDILDEITSENPVPRDAPSSDKTPLPPQTTQEQQKMKPQSRKLSLLYNWLHLQLQMRMKWNWILLVLKDLSMRIAQKRNPPILFHIRELLLVRQPVSRMALSCQEGQEGEIYPRSPLSVQTPQNQEDGGLVGDRSLPHRLPVSQQTQVRDPQVLPKVVEIVVQ